VPKVVVQSKSFQHIPQPFSEPSQPTINPLSILTLPHSINMTTYDVIVESPPADRNALENNKYLLQVARSVSSLGKPAKFNVVFQTKPPKLISYLSLVDRYGLNWVSRVPASGAEVKVEGNWQAVQLGDSYDLTDRGLWAPSSKNPNADLHSLNVGKNENTSAVHVVVGVQNPDTQIWTPVCTCYFSPTSTSITMM